MLAAVDRMTGAIGGAGKSVTQQAMEVFNNEYKEGLDVKQRLRFKTELAKVPVAEVFMASDAEERRELVDQFRCESALAF